jgi:hypothetical protein
MVKDYENIGIGEILSVEQIGNLLVFGGYLNALIAIDSVNQKVLKGKVDTAIRYIHSLQVCELPNQEMYLSVNGKDPSYSNDKSDLYDVTDLGKTFGHIFRRNKENEHINKKTIKEDNQDNKHKKLIDKKDKQKISKNTLLEPSIPLKDTSRSESESKSSYCGCSSKMMLEMVLSKMGDFLEQFSDNFIYKFKTQFSSVISRIC